MVADRDWLSKTIVACIETKLQASGVALRLLPLQAGKKTQSRNGVGTHTL